MSRILSGAALVRAQTLRTGLLDGRPFAGLDFLALVDDSYGITLEYYEGRGIGCFIDPSLTCSLEKKAGIFRKEDRHRRKEGEIIPRVRKHYTSIEGMGELVGNFP